jgi:acyl-CoA synthetase (AMP-forming)/AMP-acid ligase II
VNAIDQLALWDLVEWRAGESPDAVFAVDERGARLTFAEYRARCEDVARALAALGIARETRVAWMLPTWIEALVAAGALACLGAVQIPLIPILREREVSFIVRQSGAAHLLVPGGWRGFDYPAMAEAVAANIGDVRVTVVDPRLPDAADGPLADWSVVRPAPPDDDPRRWIFYTSGTTAHPKGTLHTDRTVAAAAHRLNSRFAMTTDDRNALVFPVTHIGGIVWLMGGLMAGYRQILVETFDAERSCAVLRAEGVTIAGSGPAFWIAYVAEQRRTPGTKAFPRLRALVGGGAAKSPTLNDEVRDVLGVPLVTGYGSSECPGVAHSAVWDTEAVRKLDGYALDDSEICVVGPDGAPLAPGEEGEIAVRGPMLFHGYLDPAENVGVFDAEGRFLTGDLGVLDAAGCLRVTGRVKDIIIRKGENISAKEVEDVLHVHPGVADVAAVAVPDAERGELCLAVIVAADPAAPPSLADLADHCVAHGLARQKIPERLEFVDRLPRNATGKVLKQELASKFSGD